MKIKTKLLKEPEIDNYIRDNNGELTDNVVLLAYANAPERKGFLDYYEFDDGSLLLVMKQLTGRRATLYYDKDAYVKNMIKIREWNTNTPLGKQQDIIQNLSQNIQPLLNELYLKLKLEAAKTTDVDLNEIDKAIKKYGYEKAYEDLFLNLIVFCGEYLKVRLGGGWITEKSKKNELVPIFIDGEKRRHELNSWIEKDIKKNGKFSMEVIIGVELNGPMNVYPNPTLGSPNIKE
jgi:hypothetical protein